jgi:hypothetical protein
MKRFFALVVALAIVSPIVVSAEKKPNKHKGKSNAEVTVVFSGAQREAVRSYFVTEHGRGKCPPGLAKKNNGCLPPGQAKKRYVVGHSLPRGIVIDDLPVELSIRIGHPPAGYRYGMIDGDVVELAVGTMLVIDAIEGLVR